MTGYRPDESAGNNAPRQPPWPGPNVAPHYPQDRPHDQQYQTWGGPPPIHPTPAPARRGVPAWLWLAGGAVVVVIALVIVLVVATGSGHRQQSPS